MEKPNVLNYSGTGSIFEAKIREILPSLYSYDIVQIIDRYNEPWRRYHNESHILKMLDIVDEIIPVSIFSPEERTLLQSMIIFHDVEFKLNREPGWNERESAAFARACLERAKATESYIRKIEVGVIATITHTLDGVPEELHEVVELLIDTDLRAGLGTNSTEFNYNTVNIGMEYDPLYTIVEYQTGRKKWAKGMLAREKIFLTDWFAHHESTARENLRLCATD